MKVVALNYSFQNQLEFCSKVLLLWRYERKDFQKRPVVSAFDITKFCSVRFLRLQKFLVSAFSLQKYVVHFSDMLYYP
jgi:hypothetical protein